MLKILQGNTTVNKKLSLGKLKKIKKSLQIFSFSRFFKFCFLKILHFEVYLAYICFKNSPFFRPVLDSKYYTYLVVKHHFFLIHAPKFDQTHFFCVTFCIFFVIFLGFSGPFRLFLLTFLFKGSKKFDPDFFTFLYHILRYFFYFFF